MADYQSPRAETSSSMKKKNKKRKLHDSEKKHDKKPLKSSRINQSNDFINEPIEVELNETTMKSLEDSTPWRNLQLILSLQNKNLDIET